MNRIKPQATNSNPRRVAAKVVAKVLKENSFSNLTLSKAMDEAALANIDKGLCTELTYGTIRWANSLEHSLRRALDKPGQKIDAEIMPHLLVAAYQLQHLTEKIPSHAAVNCAVDEIKRRRPYLAGFANLILRRLGSPLHLSLLPEDETDLSKLSLAFGLPSILVQAVADTLDQSQWRAACEAMNQRPKLWLRIFHENPQLREADVHPFVPNAVTLAKAGSPTEIAGFQKGDFQVQDPASQVAALLANSANTAPMIIDFCAAPGSKSMILKTNASNNSRVIAIDVSQIKIDRIQENAKRMKLSIETMVKDARLVGEESSRWQNKADVILLDAPCSGLGTIRRHPEIKLKANSENLSQLTELQKQLLESAAMALKPQGILVYSVCSPMPQEGTLQIESFLKTHPNFSRQNPKLTLPWLPDDSVNTQNEVHLWPHLHDCDAFFAVRLKKEYD